MDNWQKRGGWKGMELKKEMALIESVNTEVHLSLFEALMGF